MNNLETIRQQAQAALDRATLYEQAGEADDAVKALNEVDACLTEINNALRPLSDQLQELRVKVTRLRTRKEKQAHEDAKTQ